MVIFPKLRSRLRMEQSLRDEITFKQHKCDLHSSMIHYSQASRLHRCLINEINSRVCKCQTPTMPKNI